MQVGSFAGIPVDLWIVFALVAVVAVFVVNRSLVRGVPVGINWLFDNHTGRRLVGEWDLNGLFIRVKSTRGKVLETIKRTAIPFDIVHVDKYKAYIAENDFQKMKEWQEKKLQDKEFKDPKPEVTGYLMHQGGLRHTTEFYVREGTGETLDPLAGTVTAEKGPDTGHTSILHEMKAAAKEFLKLWAEATKGTFQALILPIITGIGLGSMVTILLLLVTGHVR